MKCYRNVKTKEAVFEEDAEEYALDELGIQITPRGEHGEMTQEQLEFIEETVSWYFSGNWYEDEIKEDEPSTAELINEHCYYDDKWLESEEK